MPGRNGMGPAGQGPLTGWGMGRCGRPAAGLTLAPLGAGVGMGRGGGWGHRRWFHATGLTGWQRAQMGWEHPGSPVQPAPSREQELLSVKQQAASLEQTLSTLKARIQELDIPTPDVTGKESR